MERKEYELAIEAFEAMDGYKESALQIETCRQVLKQMERYDTAVTLMENGEYESAIRTFNAIKRYKDSELQIEACKTAIEDEAYNTAITLMENEEYESAIEVFKTIEGYKDSTSQLETCRKVMYEKAVSLMKNEAYNEAYIIFCKLDGYKDSDELKISAKKKNVSAVFNSAEVGDIVLFGSYEQDNDASNGKEEIEWVILTKEDKRVLAMSKYGLDSKQFNTTYSDIAWEMCTLRKWLNTSFVSKVFDEEESAMIAATRVTASVNPEYSVGTEENRVLLLSIEEVQKYLPNDELRRCVSTESAKARGEYTSSWNDVEGEETCYWWLRSSGNLQSRAAYVNFDGKIVFVGRAVDNAFCCIRPALWIDLESLSS